MKPKGGYIIWPAYFDRSKTRKEGRRVPIQLAIPNPKAEEICEACKKLGLKCEFVKDKSYPRSWWEKKGYVIVECKIKPKTKLIKLIAEKLIEIRGRKIS